MEKNKSSKLHLVGNDIPPTKVEEVSDLTLIIYQNKTFGGKFKGSDNEELEDTLVDAVEFLTMVDPSRGIMIMGLKFGDIFIPDEALVAAMTKDSSYYNPYFETTSNIKVK